MPMICMSLKWAKNLISCTGGIYLKINQKWESACDQSLEASSKRLRINEFGGHSESSSPVTPSTPTTPINLDSDDTPTCEVGGIIRPIGKKAAKRKAKAQTDDPLVEVLSKELSILGFKGEGQ